MVQPPAKGWLALTAQPCAQQLAVGAQLEQRKGWQTQLALPPETGHSQSARQWWWSASMARPKAKMLAPAAQRETVELQAQQRTNAGPHGPSGKEEAPSLEEIEKDAPY